MAEAAVGWELNVVRGPSWLIVRAAPPPEPGECDLAEQVWSLLKCHFTYRLVLELDQVEMLCSELIGQLVKLGRRVHQQEGVLRLCGLSESCQEALRATRLEDRLRNYSSREEAVLGPRPMQPR